MCTNTTGSTNVAIGPDSMRLTTTGHSNVAIGKDALQINTCGCINTALGVKALGSNTTGECNTASGYKALYGVSTGDKNVGIGRSSGANITTGECNVVIGSDAVTSAVGTNNEIVIGFGGAGAGANQTVIGNGSTTHTKLCGALSKASGTFIIPHPDPAKRETKDLQHSFVESPTEGDNLYRYSVEVTNNKSVIELPDYYRYLNKNDMVWTSPVGHFGNAYGRVTSDQRCLEICANTDGQYNLLLIGTRKDICATSAWRGTEPDRTVGSPARNLA